MLSQVLQDCEGMFRSSVLNVLSSFPSVANTLDEASRQELANTAGSVRLCSRRYARDEAQCHAAIVLQKRRLFSRGAESAISAQDFAVSVVLGLPVQPVFRAKNASDELFVYESEEFERAVQSLDTEGIWRQLSELSLEVADHEEYPDEAQEGRKERLAAMQAHAVAQTRLLAAQEEKKKANSLGGHAECVLANLRVVEDGRIIITTKAYRMDQFTQGYLQCDQVSCGYFCRAKQGLRDHYQIVHKFFFEQAMAHCRLAHQRVAGTFCEEQEVQADAKAIEASRAKLPPFHYAAQRGDLETLKQLASSSSERPHPLAVSLDKNKSPALHWAVGEGHLACARYIVEELGGDANQPRVLDGRYPLHWAARGGHWAVCEWLLEKKAFVDVESEDGTTPFMLAAWQGHLGVCERLKLAGADPNKENVYACHALHFAVQTPHVAMCQWLVDCGLSAALINNNGHSLLHKVAQYGQLETCKWLLGLIPGGTLTTTVTTALAPVAAASSPESSSAVVTSVNGVSSTVTTSSTSSASAASTTATDLTQETTPPTTFELRFDEKNIEQIGTRGLTLAHLRQDKEGSTPIDLARIHNHHAVWALLIAYDRRVVATTGRLPIPRSRQPSTVRMVV